MDITEQMRSTLNGEMKRNYGEQIFAGMLSRAKDGMPTGVVPLGYQQHGKHVTITGAAASHIRTIFAWLDRGDPVRTAWRRASAAGLRSNRNKPLAISSFQLIVRNPFYAGFIRFGGELHQGIHEPLVSVEQFWRVQEKLK